VKKKKLNKILKRIEEQQQNIENLNHQQRWMLNIIMKKYNISDVVE
jgi:hypothetical protein